MDKNLVLKTITDFDFGVGGVDRDFVRVSEVAEDVSETEINLITWLLLEQEFTKIKDEPEVHVGGGDTLDASTTAIPKYPIQVGYGIRPKSFKTQAKRYSEELLRAVGVSVPFELLSNSKREELFVLFSSQSNLLRGEKFRSIIDLYEALRRRSKFREEFEIINTLGKGEFGVVYSVEQKRLGLTTDNIKPGRFAVKQIVISSFDAVDSINMVLNESGILKKLHDHPHIVKHYNSWLEIDQNDSETLVFYLQMELCDLPLREWMEENPDTRPSHHHLLAITTQLLDALKWIHQNNCLHLDINPKNILWTDKTYNSVKITDFGLAVRRTSNHGRLGTVPYVAPEHTLNPKSDVYSLGVTLLEFSLNISTRAELITRIDNRDFQTDVPFLDEILPLMLRKQPSQRLSASEALEMLSEK